MCLVRANSLAAYFFTAVFAFSLPSQEATAQGRSSGHAESATATSTNRTVQTRYPASLVVCKNLDGENPDVWSPDACAAEIPVCDNSGHSGNVLFCLAYPAHDFRGSQLQAAAFAVSRIDNWKADECTQKWPRIGTKDLGPQKIAGLNFQHATAEESARSHVAEQSIYRIYHKGACYELDINVVLALDTAFAAEDVPRKLTPAEHDQIRNTLEQALAGFRFLK